MPFVNGTWVEWNTTINATNIADLVTYINSTTNNWFGLLVLLSVFVVVFVAGLRRDVLASLSTSMFITTIVGILFRALGLIDNIIFVLLIIGTVGTAVLLYITRGGRYGI